MTRLQAVAVVATLAVVVVAFLLAGVGDGGDSPLEAQAQAGSGEGGSSNTVLTTVLAGVAVFVLGQIAQRFFIEPIQEQRKVLGEVTFAVLYYSGNVRYGAKPEVRMEASET